MALKGLDALETATGVALMERVLTRRAILAPSLPTMPTFHAIWMNFR
jgi:hypothetical protein